MGKKSRTAFTVYAAVVLCLTCFTTPALPPSDPLAVVSNLSDFIFGLIRAVGLILLGLGVVQVGLSFQSHDPSQRSQGFLTLAGGLVITFVKEVFLLQADKRAYPIGGYALHKTKNTLTGIYTYDNI